MIRHLLETYGYAGVFVLVGLESLGVPLPGEAALLTAAAFAAQGHLSIVGVILAAAAGGIAGDTAGYWIGRKGGLAAVRRYGKFLHIDDATLERARAFFQRHGGKTVFLGRFVSLLRMWAAVLAGVSRMPYGRFGVYNAAGGLCWATLFGSLGYLFGRSLPQLQKAAGQAGTMVGLLLAVILALVLLGRWFQSHQDETLAWVRSQLERISTSGVVQRFRKRHPRAWVFLAQRFSRTEYLGLHLTLGLVLSLGALWLFAGISEDVIHHDPLTQFDLTVANALHRQGTPVLIELAKGISQLGSPGFAGAWSLVVCVVLLKERQRVLLIGWIAALAGGGLLDQGLKLAFRRPRPTWEAPYLVAHGWSFPSGHAMGSLVAYGMLAYVLVLHLRSGAARRAVIAGTVVLVLAIGFTRLFLGVHFFSDVIAGYAGGTVWLAACITGLEVIRRKGRYLSMTQPVSAY
jgi:membrane protein DedA with SNARE-associated domain/membrane-associated phospholipid phosphatase